MKVSIIIPNWNGKALLEKNLPSVITASNNLKNLVSEIIVVDDASTDDSVNFLKEKYNREIRLIKHTSNRGFSASVNTGVRMARSALVCLLNTDVTVQKDFLAHVFPHFKDNNVFAVSLHEKGYGFSKGKFENGFITHSPGGQPKGAVETFWVSGGSGVFRRSQWLKLKGLDEALYVPFYWEDLDICYRAQKRGLTLYWEPKAIVVHKHESTIKKLNHKYVSRIQERNQLLFIWKNLTSQSLKKRHFTGLLRRLISHPGYIKIVLAALSKYGRVRKLRKKEKKEARVSDEAIFARFQ